MGTIDAELEMPKPMVSAKIKGVVWKGPNRDPWGIKDKGRWGGNDQPEYDLVYHVLSLLPVEKAAMLAPDKLYIELYEPIDVWRAFILGRLNPDDPPEGIGDGQKVFIFWWD